MLIARSKRTSHKRTRVVFSSSILVLASFVGCVPGLDGYSTEFGHGGGGGGGGGGRSGTAGETAVAGLSGGGTSGGMGGSAGALAAGGHGGQIGSAGSTAIAGTGAVTGSAGDVGQAGATECAAGLADCNSAPGCETALATGNPSGMTVADCGTCGTTCSLANATKATCTSGGCNSTCALHFADCNAGLANDGCEAATTNPFNCGSCNRACSHIGTSSVACPAGLCKPTCSANYGDCNADNGVMADDGCETYLGALTRCGTTCSNTVACLPTEVCNAGTCGAAQGLAAMTVHFTATGQDQRFADIFPSPNLTNATITVRLYAPGATGGAGQISMYVSDGDSTAGPSNATVSLDTLAAGWTDVSLAIGPLVSNFDPSTVKQINFEVQSAAVAPASWPASTVIYLDSVLSNNLVINDTFDADKPPMVQSSLQVIPGSGLAWVASVP